MVTIDSDNNITNNIGDELYSFIKELFPICRSITGNGVRETLKIIKNHIQIEIHEVPSGTKVFDWTIPKEWNIRDAYIKNSNGEKVVDFQKSNLHILQYSIPINKKISLDELKNHLYTIEDYPNWIPYKTSYYQENWGFCLSHNDYLKLKDDEYEIFIDSTLENGSLSYGEILLKGEQDDEILFSTYVCHPSMCNDNLTGIAILIFLAKSLKNKKLKNSYRFLFIPETIGAITWLSINENNVGKIKGGLVATCLGDLGCFTYKKSRIGNSVIDQTVQKILDDSESDYDLLDFFPTGSDERQFCSPSFNLPIGSLTRTIYGKFPEYHTSADNLQFINSKSLADSFKIYSNVIDVLENNQIYINVNPKCEPNLGKRGLYNLIGASKNSKELNEPLLWILNQSDGSNSLLDISIKSGLNFLNLVDAAKILYEHNLIKLKN
jgi:aminopeptidase-like protein